MTKHNNQLLPCPFCGSAKTEKRHDDGIAWTRCKSCGATGPELSKYSGEEGEPCTDWNTRAQLSAGGAVPEGYALVPIKPTTEMLDELTNGDSRKKLVAKLRWQQALAAAPHPVSGEQKPIGKVLSEEEMGIAYDRKAGPVLWFGQPAPGFIYAAPPAAQDVSGLVKSAAAYLNALDSGADEYDVKRARSDLRHDLAAHRAQAQGGDV